VFLVKPLTLETLPSDRLSCKLVMCVLVETMTQAPGPLRREGVRELPIVGGNLALDFANTVDDPYGPQPFDYVADYRGLVTWSQRMGTVSDRSAVALHHIADDQPRQARATVRRAQDLRAAINETFGALADGRSPNAGWQQLRPFVTSAIQHAGVTSPPQPSLSWNLSDLESPLWPVAEAAYLLLVGPETQRLKRCAGCPWLFLDRSKNHSRRWCTMEICGTDEKIRRYVTKRADRRSR
jgi:predicted RNA-binding Zn ribbon-like protein